MDVLYLLIRTVFHFFCEIMSFSFDAKEWKCCIGTTHASYVPMKHHSRLHVCSIDQWPVSEYLAGARERCRQSDVHPWTTRQTAPSVILLLGRLPSRGFVLVRIFFISFGWIARRVVWSSALCRKRFPSSRCTKRKSMDRWCFLERLLYRGWQKCEIFGNN